MNFSEFEEFSVLFWDQYLLNSPRVKNTLTDPNISTPNIIILTETQEHFILELSGATDNFRKLTTKKRKVKNTSEYFTQFKDRKAEGPTFNFADTTGVHIANLSFTDISHSRKFHSTFPMLTLLPSRMVFDKQSDFLSFGRNFSDARISNCILLNSNEAIFRAKYILECFIFSKHLKHSEFQRLFFEYFKRDPFIGLNLNHCRTESNFKTASQLQSLYFSPSVHETAIGQFINMHSEIITESLGIAKYEYEPHLTWIEKPAGIISDDQAINPDMIFCRNDGKYHILDFKTALLDKNKITQGEWKRRTPINAINKGIAQLTHYKEYFSIEKNREHARNKYGIDVIDPHLYLIAGNFNNTDQDELIQALRPHAGSVTVIDYDSLIQTFLTNSLRTSVNA